MSTIPREEEHRFFSHKARHLAMVPEKLIGVFRNLVSGAAPWPLFLHGPPGVGKSCAVLALTDFVPNAAYTTAGELAARHLAEVTGRGEKINWARYTGKACGLVVLDEIAVRDKVTDTHYEAVQRLLDHRDGYPLIVVSNLDGNGVGRVYDARIASRVLAGCQFEMKGEDRRIG